MPVSQDEAVGSQGSPFPSMVVSNLARIRDRIKAAGGDPAQVTVVAVTKGFGADAAQAAVDAGITDLGENYAQELVDKVDHVTGAPRWHFLGPVQHNKVARLSRYVACWHGIDQVGVGEAVARRHPGARVLVQVNATGEASKHGCRPDDVVAVVAGLQRLDLTVVGLMTIGPAGAGEDARPAFRLVAAQARQLGLSELSMGMTDDLEVAVQEGATVIRIGRGLFGRRDRASLGSNGRLVNGGD